MDLFFARHPLMKDLATIVGFIICVLIGTIFIHQFVFRSFNVQGPSSEPTLLTGDRLIINRLPVTRAALKNQMYVPSRGDFIVFKNPRYSGGVVEEYLVKRVIGLPGERVQLKDGQLWVYNQENPEGFNADATFKNYPGQLSAGSVDMTIPENSLFVAGDHRQGDYSFDSRVGLGSIPLYGVIGPVVVRIFPFNRIRIF